MQTKFNVLFIGDVVGRYGRRALRSEIDNLKREFDIDFTIVNIENAADGFGVNKKVYAEIEGCADALTMGNHTWDKQELIGEINKMEKLIRPINFSKKAPGVGFRIFSVNGVDILIANAIGRIFMVPVDNPFDEIENILDDEFSDIKIKIVDFHAEATSEKQAFGWFVDGRVSAVLGTHTHVQTADERILPNGTAYITDAGMTGCHDGVLGFNKDEALSRFLTYMPKRLKVCKNNIRINGCIVSIDSKSGKSLQIERINRAVEF
jgi:metallophosphoesterase (TIGR00282 family)